MMGCVFRFGIDDVGVCLFLCYASRKEYYKKFFFELFFVELYFDYFLYDFMVVEIVMCMIEMK